MQRHRSCRSNKKTLLPILLVAVYLGSENWSSKIVRGSFFLQQRFPPVFTQEDLENLSFLPQAFQNISQLHFDTVGIAKLLSNLDIKKAAGTDQIPCWVLKNAAQEIAPLAPIPATVFLTFSEDRGCPAGLEKANIHAIFKKGDRSRASNYRPISLTSVFCKIMEYI